MQKQSKFFKKQMSSHGYDQLGEEEKDSIDLIFDKEETRIAAIQVKISFISRIYQKLALSL